MNCSNCSESIQPGFAFCGKCGQPVQRHNATSDIRDNQESFTTDAADPVTPIPSFDATSSKTSFIDVVKSSRPVQIGLGALVILVIFLIAQASSGASSKELSVRLEMSPQYSDAVAGQTCESWTGTLGGQVNIKGNVFLLKDATGKVLGTAHVPDSGTYVQYDSLRCEYKISFNIPAASDNVELSDGQTTDVWISASDLATNNWDLAVDPQ